MTYTLGQAAKATGKSKTTIQRAIKSGQISATMNENGSYTIDPAELHRVFFAVTGDGRESGDMKQSETKELHRENEFLRQQLEREREINRRLFDRLDEEAAERKEAATETRRLMLMLTHQPEPKAQPTMAPFWRRLFGSP